MLLNILIGVLIFGYAGWNLYKFIQRSKEGKCGTCELRKSCKTSCSSTTSSIPVFEHKMDEPLR